MWSISWTPGGFWLPRMSLSFTTKLSKNGRTRPEEMKEKGANMNRREEKNKHNFRMNSVSLGNGIKITIITCYNNLYVRQDRNENLHFTDDRSEAQGQVFGPETPFRMEHPIVKSSGLSPGSTPAAIATGRSQVVGFLSAR